MSPFKKEILNHQTFYIVKFTKNPDADYLIFIHGGPGYNCGVIEYLMEHDNLFGLLNYNIILYDQRSCGRSIDCQENILHTDNVQDLNEFCEYLACSHKIKIKRFIGHSYGAKLLFYVRTRVLRIIFSIVISLVGAQMMFNALTGSL